MLRVVSQAGRAVPQLHCDVCAKRIPDPSAGIYAYDAGETGRAYPPGTPLYALHLVPCFGAWRGGRREPVAVAPVDTLAVSWETPALRLVP